MSDYNKDYKVKVKLKSFHKKSDDQEASRSSDISETSERVLREVSGLNKLVKM